MGAVAAIAAGSNGAVAIKPNGTVFAWGSNSTGALGFGMGTQKNVPIQLLSDTLPDVSTVAAGGNHNLITHVLDPGAASHPDDAVLAWGLNTSGQLGAGSVLPYAEPQLIPGLHPLFSGSPAYGKGQL